MKLKTLKMAGLLATLGLGFAAPASATDKALLDTLVSNGVITQEQANEIRGKSAVVVSPNRPTTNQMRIRGRIMGQWASSNGSNSNADVSAGDYDSFEIRRARLGVQGKFADTWDYQLEINALSSVDVDSAFVAYNFANKSKILFGKDKPQFGLEENTSSASILTIERSVVTNYFQGGKPIGLRYFGSADIFSYYVGVFNGSSVSTDRQPAGGDSYIYNASVGLTFDEMIGGGHKLRFRLDYLNSGKDSSYYRFDDALAFSGHYGVGEFDLRAEYFKGEDKAGRDVDGFYVMPSFYIVPKTWQAVLRYESVDGDPGVNLGTHRYADRIPGGYRSGNEYESIYAGINYYIKGDNLKLMFGVDRGTNKDSVTGARGRATTFASSVRMQF